METKHLFVNISKIGLIIINIIVVVFGIVSLGIGIWAASSDRDYLDISGKDDRYNSVGVLLAIVGSFVLIVGSIGIFGLFCASKLVGRILLVGYAIIMFITIVMVFAGAIAGYVQRDDLKTTLRGDAYRTLNDTETNKDYLRAWNDAQKTVHCCGVDSAEDWLLIQWRNDTIIGVIPLSCCAKVGGCSGEYIDPENEDDIVWSQGCVDAIVDKVSEQIGAVAGISVTILIMMIIAVVMALIVVVCNKKTKKYEVV